MRLDMIHIAGLVIVGLSLVWQDAHSDELVMHIGSKHMGESHGYDFNESNLGVGYRHYVTDSLAFNGGVYDNSYNNTSVYAGGTLVTSFSSGFAVGVQGGVVTGYADTPQGTGVITGYILPFVRVREGRVFAEVGYLPPVNGISVVTGTVGVSW